MSGTTVNLNSKIIAEIFFCMVMALGVTAIVALSLSTKSWSVPLILSTVALVAALVTTISIMLPEFTGAPWVPTSGNLVDKILTMSELKPGELLYDLGSGDGRIVIAAARDFDARSVGIEIDPFRALYSRLRISQLRLKDKARIVRGNFFNLELRDADVVVLYLLPETNTSLQRKLEKELTKPNCRVVSVVFKLEGWEVIRAEEEKMIYVYKLPSEAKSV
jgi:SAM-dependent methyltransferase